MFNPVDKLVREDKRQIRQLGLWSPIGFMVLELPLFFFLFFNQIKKNRNGVGYQWIYEFGNEFNTGHLYVTNTSIRYGTPAKKNPPGNLQPTKW